MAPAICDRDLVVLDMGRAEPLDDQVFVVLTGEGLVAKRLRRWDDSWELNRDNPGVRIPGRSGPGANPRSGRVDGATVRWTARAGGKEPVRVRATELRFVQPVDIQIGY